MAATITALRSWGSRTTTPLKESTKENISVPNSPSSEKDARALKRIDAKKSTTRQQRNQNLWLAAVWAAVWVKQYEKNSGLKQRTRETKLAELISELRGDNAALNDQLIALKSAKKVLQTKLARVEEELKTAEGLVASQGTAHTEELTKAQQTIATLTEERSQLLVTLAEMEQVRSSEQQAKTRQIYHHQEEMRAVRIDHERERAELLETIKKMQSTHDEEQKRIADLEAELARVKEVNERAEVNYERQLTQMYRVYYDIDEIKTQFLWSKIPVPLSYWEDVEKQGGELEEATPQSTGIFSWLRYLFGRN